jgi:hypothetical protein
VTTTGIFEGPLESTSISEAIVVLDIVSGGEGKVEDSDCR